MRVLSTYSSYCVLVGFVVRAINSRLPKVYTVTDGKVVSGLVALKPLFARRLPVSEVRIYFLPKILFQGSVLPTS